MNDVSASAQRSPRRSVRRAGSASVDMPAAMPCAPSRMRAAPVKPSCARYAASRPSAAAFAVCSCFESAASRRNSHSPAACVPAEPNACCISVADSPSTRPVAAAAATRSRGAGRVEHLVVRAAEKFADADADFVAGDGGGQQVAPGRSAAPARPRAPAGTRRRRDGTPSRCARRPARRNARRRR